MADWISWTPDLAVNVTSIDEQHRELIRQFNDLGEAVWDGKGHVAIAGILRFLADYTVQHFRDEEMLMDELNYPDSAAHKKSHENLLAEVSEFIGKFESGSVQSHLVISVVDRLGQWTRQHIRLEDKALGQYFLSKAEGFCYWKYALEFLRKMRRHAVRLGQALGWRHESIRNFRENFTNA